jgi:hypothetical protein
MRAPCRDRPRTRAQVRVRARASLRATDDRRASFGLVERSSEALAALVYRCVYRKGRLRAIGAMRLAVGTTPQRSTRQPPFASERCRLEARSPLSPQTPGPTTHPHCDLMARVTPIPTTRPITESGLGRVPSGGFS